jgi:hypothetical protein
LHHASRIDALARPGAAAEGDMMRTRAIRSSLLLCLLLGWLVAAACSDPVAVEHTTSSGNHTTSSGNLRQSRLHLPEASRDVGRGFHDATGVR